jgi:peptidoglycan/LPS O-acetylase OafA/YrhL
MSPRNYRLDSLRGIASLSVLFHHCIHSSNAKLPAQVLNVPLSSVATDDLVGRALLSLFAGGVAVNLFFILSGAVLMASLQREARFDLATIVRFAGRRVFRIYPAMIIMVATFGLLSWLLPIRAAGFTFRQIFDNSLLLSNSVNGATWTLQSEMLMVPGILLVAFGRSFLGNVATLLFLFWAVSCLFFGAPFAPTLLNVAIPSFALGMLIPTVITGNDIGKLPAWSVYLALFSLVGTRFLFPVSDIRALMGLLALSFFAVAMLFHSTQENRAFDHPTLTFLGRISYGLYLIHPVVLTALLPVFIGTLGADWMAQHYVVFGLFLGVIVTAITIPLSALCEVYVERPFIRLGQIVFARDKVSQDIGAAPQVSPAE